jgi:O-antigen/teichoic acid export membrane protein
MISSYGLIYLVGQALPAVISFLALIVYTHLLSPAEYGIYVIGTSIAGIISALSFSWIPRAVSRYQAGSPELDMRGDAIIGYGGTVAVVSCLLPAVMLVARPNIDFGVLAGSLFLSFSTNAFVISQEFQRARLDARRYMIAAQIRSILSLALGYAVIVFGGGGLSLLAATGMSFVIANFFCFQRNVSRPLRLFPAHYLMQFVRYGMPFSLGAASIALHNTLDRLGVAYLLGPSAAGNYGLAAETTRQLMLVLASSFASAMFPIAFRTFGEAGAAATRKSLSEGLEFLLALIVPVAVWLAISAEAVAGTLLGSEYQAQFAALLPLLAMARMCGAVNQYYLQISFQLAEKPLLQVAHDTLIFILNAALFFWLTHEFGLIGTATSVLVAETLGIPIGIWLSRRTFKMPFNGWGTARVLAATAIMAMVTYAAKAALGGHGALALLGMTCGGGVAYLGSAIFFNVAGVRSLIAPFLRPRSVAAE